MRRTLAALAVLSWSLLVTRVEPAKQIATVHDIQPSARDVCHAVWMHGPTHGGKLGGQWPTFAPTPAAKFECKSKAGKEPWKQYCGVDTKASCEASGAAPYCEWVGEAPTGNGDTSAQCTTRDDRFTGYNNNGQYCEKASDELNTNAHLLLYSGHLAVVVDAAGISAAVGGTGTVTPRNLFPKFGSTTGLAANVRCYLHPNGLTLVTTSCTPLRVHGSAHHKLTC